MLEAIHAIVNWLHVPEGYISPPFLKGTGLEDSRIWTRTFFGLWRLAFFLALGVRRIYLYDLRNNRPDGVVRCAGSASNRFESGNLDRDVEGVLSRSRGQQLVLGDWASPACSDKSAHFAVKNT